jgi:hypothetical protein
MRTIVTKGDFAKMKGRVPAAVSNWIADGKITAAALVGTGKFAKIWVEQAERDLAINLDPAQQAAQPHPINQTSSFQTASVMAPTPTAVIVPPQEAAPPPAPVASPYADDIGRKRKADADAAEFAAERARRQALADEGRWIEAEPARQQWTGELRKIVGELETYIGTILPQEIADELQLDWKQVSLIARNSFRSYRQRVADKAAGIDIEEPREAAE